MRFTSAAVLSTLAVGQAAAANIRHASFHARRAVEKREDKPVDWASVTYDLKNVDWSKVNWNSVFSSSATPSSTPPPKVEEVKVEAVSTPTPTPTPTPSSTSAAPAEKTEKPNVVEHITNDILSGLDSFLSKLGISQKGANSYEPNGGIWLGDSDWSAEFTNGGSKDVKLFCWKANGFSGMSLNVNQPAISINLAPGASQNVSFAEGVPSSCAPADDSTSLAMFGGIQNTWWEVTFGSTGAFDVSRNVWMQGTNIHSQGSKCTSDMDTCVFKCKDESAQSCEKGYELYNCDAGNGGGGGYDPIMDGTGGGCSMGSSGEHVKVTFS
ncbi:hypothetical protein BU24DRAFT_428441 [Aaosphaeria arxii CBS 175.79]|uniref:Uncharacterized protein n=1 Tax=Aaosphaeria arxii CBS 175.79 TaxID=1450172 RepID=A0A6A5X900_9PLEO|nr:uncharacterized protein BU24DRAFT_428441 [Aaosphaeria arxii CBS 175.79]KAF2009545.1 hypothetical protein BU24DRAFT_428441 [Aaosphaeria arxii CBS 175.79]